MIRYDLHMQTCNYGLKRMLSLWTSEDQADLTNTRPRWQTEKFTGNALFAGRDEQIHPINGCVFKLLDTSRDRRSEGRLQLSQYR